MIAEEVLILTVDRRPIKRQALQSILGKFHTLDNRLRIRVRREAWHVKRTFLTSVFRFWVTAVCMT